MKHEETLLHMRLLLAAAGYHADDLTERLFDALIDLHHHRGAVAVRDRAKELNIPFANKAYKSRNTP